MLVLEVYIFFVASLLALIIAYFSSSQTLIHQFLAVLTLVLMLFLKRKLPFFQQKSIHVRSYNMLLLFTSSLFVQLLVLSTGGFYSMFLIMLYLYALGVSLILNMRSAISFLIFSVLMLCANIGLNEQVRVLFIQDPWSPIVYIISFLITIPITDVVIRTYRLHEVLAKSLANYVEITEKRQQTILQGVSEMVIVTDQNLTILSVNESAEKELSSGSTMLQQKSFFDVCVLLDKQGIKATKESFGVIRLKAIKTTQVIEGFFLQTLEGHPTQVIIQVTPIIDQQGVLSQFAFILKKTHTDENRELQTYLEEARTRHKALMEQLKNFPELQSEIEHYAKVEDDKVVAMTVKSHSITASVTRQDIISICKRVVAGKEEFAQSHNVKTTFAVETYSLTGVRPSSFFAAIDGQWFDVLLRKLLDIAILLAASEINPAVSVTIQDNDNAATIVITSSCPPLLQGDIQNLLKQNYGELIERTKLKEGSGLEGYLAQTIATQLNIPLIITYEGNHLIEKLTLHRLDSF